MSDSPAPYSPAQRRLLTAAGGLGVAALAGATFVLSYDDLRALALRGGAARDRAFLYPGMVDGLVVVVILSILIARRAPWWARAVRWLLLLALIVGAGAAGVERAVRGYGGLSHAWLSGGVAAAPWVILAVAVWLWLSMIKQLVRTRRRDPAAPAAPEPSPDTPDDDRAFIPGLSDEAYAETRPLPRPAPPRALEPGPDAVRDRPRDSASPAVSGRPAAEPVPDRERLPDLPPAEHVRDQGPSPSLPSAERVRDQGPSPSLPSAERVRDRELLPDLPPAEVGDDDARPNSGRPLEAAPDRTPETAPDRTREDRLSPLLPAADTDAEPEPALPPELERQADRAWQPGPALPPGVAPMADHDTDQDSRPVGHAEPDSDLVPDTDPEVVAPMQNTPVDPEEEEPTPRWVARTSLPTDVRLVGPPQTRQRLGDTQPDGIRLPDTDPDGIPMPGVADETPAGEEEDAYADDRAADPEVGAEADDARPWSPPEGGGPWASGSGGSGGGEEPTPPSSKFRSSPTPPRG
ncbi:DUF2637 domain-containing protein [Actinoallomurus sp. NPDC052274]|uniref:DUF2637 domain-containing protein n=1 Tax=Actinoallomurus sp. NPDC052274 TaxID=3155420 RepID=UPI00341B7F33